MTIVTYHRGCLFGEILDGEMILSDLGKIADECWRAISEHFPNVELGAYVIMPNHVHGIIVIAGATHIVPVRVCVAPAETTQWTRGAVIGRNCGII